MSADEPAPEAWVPVPIRARHVAPGDTIVGRDAALFHVTGAGEDGGTWRIDVTRSYLGISHYRLDPDEVVSVLVPMTEREALTVARDELAARITERRTA